MSHLSKLRPDKKKVYHTYYKLVLYKDRVRGSNLQYYLPKYQLHININFMCIYIIYYI